MSFWYKRFPQYPENHRDYWRVVLVFHCLLISTLVPAIIALINIFIFKETTLASLDLSVSLISLGAYFWFRHSANIQFASVLLAFIITFMVTFFIYLTEGYAHSMVWALVVPPVTFFLLGRTWGSVCSSLVFAVCIYMAYQQIGNAPQHHTGYGSFLNVIEASLLILLLFRFYERTRSQAYKQLEEHNILVSELAETDHLTGLYNREKFDKELYKNCDPDNQRSVTSLLLVDVDHFKKINDSHGHLKGDEVLKALAQKLKRLVRTTDIVARWGGEEFAILLPNTEKAFALTLAERLRSEVNAHLISGLKVSISIGLVSSSVINSSDKFLQQADSALYQAKADGRNRVIAA
ncbi:GGDEF domain-containing protein [Alteromonas sp. C1M14]|uniref:diguanylate cyclase n=1 Tax=Alteromonas sp. C1M14 TaxID=2841567 RepID=UPI001C09433D|nr:diguanylate cyclase [Alteromonas sp. C1M14]